MRNKLLGLGKALLVLCLGVLAVIVLYQAADVFFDGVFGDWVKSRYYTEIGYGTEYGYYYETSVNWGMVRQDVFILLIANTVIWLIVVLWASARSRRGALGRVDKIQAELAAKEQALKAETARKNDLIAYLAHDLKTPLTSVIGYLSLLDEAADMPPEQRAKYTRIALTKACRLEKMINEFFDITRYNLQEIVIQKEPIDLYYMLVQLTDEFLPALERKGNTAVLRAEENLTVPGDPDQLARVFQNVLKNAAAYSYPHTEIVIEAWESGDSVAVRFTNRGQTIPQSKLDSIFEKFYRLDEARTSGTGGAGLGLAIAKEIVALHGGRIAAESRDETVRFTVTLPAR